MMVVSIRTALPGDVEQMRQLEVRAGTLFAEIGMHSIAQDAPPTALEFESHLKSGTVWVAWQHSGSEASGGGPTETVVGWVSGSIVDNEGHLNQVSAEPSAQGQGIGSALVARGCEWARSLGLSSVTLTTFSEVAWNGPFYARRGFVALPPEQFGPELAEIRRSEIENGLDVSPRVAMRLVLAKRS